MKQKEALVKAVEAKFAENKAAMEQAHKAEIAAAKKMKEMEH